MQLTEMGSTISDGIYLAGFWKIVYPILVLAIFHLEYWATGFPHAWGREEIVIIANWWFGRFVQKAESHSHISKRFINDFSLMKKFNISLPPKLFTSLSHLTNLLIFHHMGGSVHRWKRKGPLQVKPYCKVISILVCVCFTSLI